MSVCRRRYNAERINLLKYNSIKRQEEVSLYSIIDYNKENISDYIDTHTDFVILFIIVCWEKNFITLQECDKLINIVEGYYFAYTEGLMNVTQLCDKLNYEIMQQSLHQTNWDKIGVIEEVY